MHGSAPACCTPEQACAHTLLLDCVQGAVHDVVELEGILLAAGVEGLQVQWVVLQQQRALEQSEKDSAEGKAEKEAA